MAGEQAAPLPGHAVTPSRGRWPHRSSTTGQTPYTRSVAHLEPKEPPVRPGRVQIRPLGGWPGCLVMILFSVVASVVGTVLLNLLLR
jgi:hypothetical protein